MVKFGRGSRIINWRNAHVGNIDILILLRENGFNVVHDAEH